MSLRNLSNMSCFTATGGNKCFDYEKERRREREREREREKKKKKKKKKKREGEGGKRKEESSHHIINASHSHHTTISNYTLNMSKVSKRRVSNQTGARIITKHDINIIIFITY